MLKDFTTVLNWSLGTIGMAEYRLNLLPNTRPIPQDSYRTGAKARQREKSEIGKIVFARVTEAAQSPWASPVVLETK